MDKEWPFLKVLEQMNIHTRQESRKRIGHLSQKVTKKCFIGLKSKMQNNIHLEDNIRETYEILGLTMSF